LAINRRSAELFGFGAEKVGSFSRAQDQIRRPPPIINRDFWIDPNRNDEPENNTIRGILELPPRPREPLVRLPVGFNPQQVAVLILNQCIEQPRQTRLG